MKLNRRKVLASLGLIGASGAMGAVGTRALFSDEESVTTTTTAGTLDLKLDWKAYHNVGDNMGFVEDNQIAMQAPTDADGEVAASFNDIKPGDFGCFSLSLHNETNPAWVWLALDIAGETDGGNGDGGGNGHRDCFFTQYPWICGQEETDGSLTVHTVGNELELVLRAPEGETFNETSLEITDSLDSIPGGQGGPSPGQFEFKDEDASTRHDDYVEYHIPYSEQGFSCGDEVIIALHAETSTGETCWAGSTEIPGANWALAVSHTICCTGDPVEDSVFQGRDERRLLNLQSWSQGQFWTASKSITLTHEAERVGENGNIYRVYNTGIGDLTVELTNIHDSDGTLTGFEPVVTSENMGISKLRLRTDGRTDEKVIDYEDCETGSLGQISYAKGIDEIDFWLCPDTDNASTSSSNGSQLADNILVDVFWDDNHNCQLDAGEQVIFQNITLRDLASNMNKASGGIMPQWYSTGTQYVSFVWHVPVEVGNEIQGDTVDLKFCAYAEQRRHNTDPDNPWT